MVGVTAGAMVPEATGAMADGATAPDSGFPEAGLTLGGRTGASWLLRAGTNIGLTTEPMENRGKGKATVTAGEQAVMVPVGDLRPWGPILPDMKQQACSTR